MDITVKVIKVLDALRFASKKGDGTEVVKNRFVGETVLGQYPKRIAFSVIGEERYAQMGIVVGGQYNVSFDVESREWQGRWFTDVSAWKAVRVDDSNGGSQNQAQQPQSQVSSPIPDGGGNSTASTSNENDSDLPF